MQFLTLIYFFDSEWLTLDARCLFCAVKFAEWIARSLGRNKRTTLYTQYQSTATRHSTLVLLYRAVWRNKNAATDKQTYPSQYLARIPGWQSNYNASEMCCIFDVDENINAVFGLIHDCLGISAKFKIKNGASQTLPRHPLHKGLLWSWRLPSSRTGNNKYYAAGVLGLRRHCSQAAPVASRRRHKAR